MEIKDPATYYCFSSPTFTRIRSPGYICLGEPFVCTFNISKIERPNFIKRWFLNLVGMKYVDQETEQTIMMSKEEILKHYPKAKIVE